LRVVNNVPLLKRRMINAENEFRGADHVDRVDHAAQTQKQSV
jgi:hypothetical protein